MWVSDHSPTILAGCWRQRSDAKKKITANRALCCSPNTISGLSAAPDLTQVVNRQIEHKAWRLVPIAGN